MLTLDQMIFICVLAGFCGMLVFGLRLVSRAREIMEGNYRPKARDYVEAYVVALNLDGDNNEPRGWHF